MGIVHYPYPQEVYNLERVLWAPEKRFDSQRFEKGNIITFDVPVAAFNYITSQGWELWLHDDNYNIIQRWIIRKKVTKQMFEKLTKDEMKTTTSIELIPSAVDELIKKTR